GFRPGERKRRGFFGNTGSIRDHARSDTSHGFARIDTPPQLDNGCRRTSLPPSGSLHSVRGSKALGPEALARAMRHRRWRAVHARRSRPAVSDRREPGSAEKEREPKRVHRLIVPATRRATGASG